MENNAALRIYEKVKDLTLNKKINWSIVKESESITIFKTTVGEFELQLSNNILTTEFRIVQDKKELGRITENILSDQNKLGLINFFERVKRLSLRIDEGLDDLLGKLEKM